MGERGGGNGQLVRVILEESRETLRYLSCISIYLYSSFSIESKTILSSFLSTMYTLGVSLCLAIGVCFVG